MPRWLMVLCWIAGFTLAIAVLAYLLRDQTFAVLQTRGEVGNRERDLLYFAAFLALLVLVPVYIMIFVFAWRYRAGHKKKYQPNWDSDKRFETIWWAIPVAIISVLAVVTWVTSHSLDPYKALASTKQPLRVQVIALEWKWLFIYPDQDAASVNELMIPANRPVEFSITADAPMNSFWIPQLGGQIYAMNGMVTKLHLVADQPGDYRGMSSNISGTGFADMQFMTHAVSDQAFNAWVDSIHAHENTEDLTLASYKQLAKPSTSQVQLYHLHDPTVFNEVVMKYMGGHGMSMGGQHSAMMDDMSHTDMEAM